LSEELSSKSISVATNTGVRKAQESIMLFSSDRRDRAMGGDERAELVILQPEWALKGEE
jgi:hypothetical protein